MTSSNAPKDPRPAKAGAGGRRYDPAMEDPSMTVSHAEPETRSTLPSARLAELEAALTRETEIVEELREALIRQREGVASTSADQVNASVDAIGRILLTLDEARRRRGGMIGALTGDPTARLDSLDARLGFALPESCDRSRVALRRAAERVAQEVSINRGVLRHAVEAGEAFLQALFSTTAGPAVYEQHERPEKPPGMLLNRRA